MQLHHTAAGLLQRLAGKLHVDEQTCKIVSVALRELLASHLALLSGSSLETCLFCLMHAALHFFGLDTTFTSILPHQQLPREDGFSIVEYYNTTFVPATAGWLMPLFDGGWKILPPLPVATSAQAASIQPSPNVRIQSFTKPGTGPNSVCVIRRFTSSRARRKSGRAQVTCASQAEPDACVCNPSASAGRVPNPSTPAK